MKFQDLYTKSKFGGNSIMMVDNATAGGNSSRVAHNASCNLVSILTPFFKHYLDVAVEKLRFISFLKITNSFISDCILENRSYGHKV